jgi:drug/metabolite transporter (DMT)-like permease
MSLAVAYILISVVTGAAGQLLLKRGMMQLGPLTLEADQLLSLVWRLATSPYVLLGLAIYVGGLIFWLLALSRVDLSFAYPFASLSYVIMLLASWLLFQEQITPLRLAGTAVVCLGVLLISRS